jgi:hypothetical protein
MRQSKLAETLRTLTTRERTRWRQFIWSDFHNRHQHLRLLCDVVLKHAPDFYNTLEKKAVFAQVFGASTPFNELKCNNLISDLYEKLLDWLATERLQDDPLEHQFHCVMALLERNLNKQAAAALEKYKYLLHQSPQRNTRWYQHAANIEEAAEILHSRQPKRTDSPHLRQQAQYNHFAQILEKLRLALALRSRSSLAVLQSEGTAALHLELDHIRSDSALLAALPVAHVYLHAFDLLENPVPEAFNTLMAALQANAPLCAREELAALYQCALNYCIRCINAGQVKAYDDALSLYRILLDSDLLLQRGQLSQWTYKNIATTGLRSGAFVWTEKFLYDYRDALPADVRDNAFAFNLATLYFEKQAFDLTLQTLQNVEFTDFTYHIGAKFLQLKTFYLLHAEDALMPLLATTEQLLRRDKTLSTFGKTTNLNFLKMLRQLSLWKQKRLLENTKDAETKHLLLHDKIKTLQPLVNRDWLLHELEQLKPFKNKMF